MFFNNGEDKNKCKRNSKEPEEDFAITDIMRKPFTSFTSLLMEDDDDDDDAYQIPNTDQQYEKIDHIIKAHNKSLRRTLAEARLVDYTVLQREAEERVVMRMRELEKELGEVVRLNEASEKRLVHFKRQGEYWKGKASILEETRKKLRKPVEVVKMHVGCAGGEEEDAESSYVDMEKGGEEGWSTWQACRVCGKRVGTVMLWPCRHVSVCVSCENNTKTCPVCRSLKTASLEVRLP